MEPQACLVDIEPLGDLTVYTSTQAAFYCRTRVAETVDLPTQRVKVVPMPVGGGFGGKFVLIEPMVAAAALAVGRPVCCITRGWRTSWPAIRLRTAGSL